VTSINGLFVTKLDSRGPLRRTAATEHVQMGHNLTRKTNIRRATLSSTTKSRRFLNRYAIASLPLLFGQTAAAEPGHHYLVTVDTALEHLSIEATFDPPIHRISARAEDAGEVLLDAQDCDSGETLQLRGRRLTLPDTGLGCLRYRVDLKQAAVGERRNQSLSADNVIVSPTVWLWRPPPDETRVLRVQFDLPTGIHVSVPWAQDGLDTYRVAPSPESAAATALFGRFEYHEIEVADATLRVSLAKNDKEIDTAAILNWITAAAMDVTLAYGRFPNRSPQIIVLPVGDRGRWAKRGGESSAVRFGRVVRDGGESVELFVNHDRPLADFLDDWTATHEFSHLMLPYVSRKQKWLSEGFAQYYQNILLARSGAYQPEYAWQKLYEGLERGRRSRPELSPNEAAAGNLRDSLMKVYWSGAAFALLADVTLRERSGGEESLDFVLDRLQACCLPAADVWTGPDFLMQLDAMLDEPVFMPLYRRHADTAGFPDVAETLQRLGVHVEDGVVELRNDAELTSVRTAITVLDPQTARWRRRLAAN